ncbi:MAG: helix-turn-helix transcriptional regulator [Microbacterium sp.]|uniref:helix-turn-helix transcriptional regulator n=1 Tax=Microbacterium sp. TaxID=51671 RepID=UPI003A873EA7
MTDSPHRSNRARPIPARSSPARSNPVAADRVAIVMTLVPYVVEHGPTRVDDAARLFRVTPGVMREMVENLNVIGLPGGMDNELFSIDWDAFDERDEIVLVNVVAFERAPRLSSREAAALLAGLQFAQAVPVVAEQGVVAGLLAKLARGAGAPPGELALALDPVDDVRATVSDAMTRQRAVSFTYRPIDGEVMTRTVDPIRILAIDAQWYLRGWCHLRQAVRTFHLERVSDLVVTQTPAAAHDDSETELFTGPHGEVVARIRYPEHVAPLLGQYLDHAEVEAKADATGRSTATLHVSDPRALKRLAARRGGAVEVLEPDEARVAAAEWARAALAQYGR